MLNPTDLSRDKLATIVDEIRHYLFWDDDAERWDLGKPWDCADLCSLIATSLSNSNLTPSFDSTLEDSKEAEPC